MSRYHADPGDHELLPSDDDGGRPVTDVIPEFPDIEEFRHQASLLLESAQEGQPGAVEKVKAVSDRVDINSARSAMAAQFGFPTWEGLEMEVERKTMIQRGDVEGLGRLVSSHPHLSSAPVSSCFENDNVLGYLGVAWFHGLTAHHRAGEMSRVLLSAGAPADGMPDTPESPLVTAASYGETDMVKALIDAGADLETTGSAVEGGTALAHAVEFGNVDVVDVLVKAGAVVHGIVEAAGTGDLGEYQLDATPLADKAGALRAAAVCERLEVIDEILASDVPVDADPDAGSPNGSRSVLHDAAYYAKPASVRHLLELGADPNRRDRDYGASPLGWCRHRRSELAVFGDHLTSPYDEVEGILEPVTTDPE